MSVMLSREAVLSCSVGEAAAASQAEALKKGLKEQFTPARDSDFLLAVCPQLSFLPVLLVYFSILARLTSR